MTNRIVLATVLVLSAACRHEPQTPASRVVVTSTTVQVPAGSFVMGCDDNLDTHCVADEKPLHAVKLSAFEIDRSPVSQHDYLACMKSGQCTEPEGGAEHVSQPLKPVTAATWYQAVSYCVFVGKSLPTEAQWERAAPHILIARREWVRDYYESRYDENQPYDPQGPVSGLRRVLRGDDDGVQNSSRRMYVRSQALEGMAYADIGFRCVKSADWASSPVVPVKKAARFMPENYKRPSGAIAIRVRNIKTVAEIPGEYASLAKAVSACDDGGKLQLDFCALRKLGDKKGVDMPVLVWADKPIDVMGPFTDIGRCLKKQGVVAVAEDESEIVFTDELRGFCVPQS